MSLVALLGRESRAGPTASEHARIGNLIHGVERRTDIRSVRDGAECSGGQAAELVQGKLKSSVDKVDTVQEFIEMAGARPTTGGGPYRVRSGDGRTLPSAMFLQQELERIESRR